jgi:hypothetical protein
VRPARLQRETHRRRPLCDCTTTQATHPRTSCDTRHIGVQRVAPWLVAFACLALPCSPPPPPVPRRRCDSARIRLTGRRAAEGEGTEEQRGKEHSVRRFRITSQFGCVLCRGWDSSAPLARPCLPCAGSHCAELCAVLCPPLSPTSRAPSVGDRRRRKMQSVNTQHTSDMNIRAVSGCDELAFGLLGLSQPPCLNRLARLVSVVCLLVGG